MASFLERYTHGEHVEVWRELRGLGEAALEGPACEDVQRVADEVATRSYENLRRLRATLTQLGYRFAHPERALVEASPEGRLEVDQLEASYGRLPLIIRAWYDRIECVDFQQSPDQLETGSESPGLVGLGTCPALVFLSVPRAMRMREELLEEAEVMGGDEPQTPDPGGFFLPLGGWASNCEAKGIVLPSQELDPVIYNDGGGEVRFVDELRLAFRWGGFPFWSSLVKRPEARLGPAGPAPRFREIWPKLVDGLLPI